LEAVRAGLDSLSKRGYSRLWVGAGTTACQHILPKVLREFRQSFPQCEIRIEPSDNSYQLDRLHSGQVDLALVIEPPSPAQDEFTFVPSFRDELGFFVARQHPWVKLGRAPCEQIATETIFLCNKASHTFRLVCGYFGVEKITLNNLIELGSMEAIKELVKIGRGVGLLAPWIAQAELEIGARIVAAGIVHASPALGRRASRRGAARAGGGNICGPVRFGVGGAGVKNAGGAARVRVMSRRLQVRELQQSFMDKGQSTCSVVHKIFPPDGKPQRSDCSNSAEQGFGQS